MYVQINIGRGIDGEPMNMVMWEQFISDVADSLRAAGKNHLVRDVFGATMWLQSTVVADMPIEVHKGGGYWAGESEESAHISTYWESGFRFDILKSDLLDLGGKYGQNTIALVTGSELI